MYFKDRLSAGGQLVPKLSKYRSDNCSIVALSPGAVLVGVPIAEQLHSNLILLLAEDIDIPGEPTPLAAVTSDDSFTYNPLFSIGEIEEFNMEYFNLIQQERMNQLHNLHLILGKHGEINKSMLRHHVVILISDGLNNGFSINIAKNFLTSVAIKKMVSIAPFSTYDAFDKMEQASDEAVVLNMVDNFLGVDHYYDDNNIPDVNTLLDISDEIALLWKHPKT
jgi:predicted phosphoribosyltransferase